LDLSPLFEFIAAYIKQKPYQIYLIRFSYIN